MKLRCQVSVGSGLFSRQRKNSRIIREFDEESMMQVAVLENLKGKI
ncbi:hypothetical protein NME41_11270 [Streptococcus agalactiae]|nr:hypothetical protein [Streptococcus agalactiae]